MNIDKTILVVAAHPDDEVLGCGGTLARHAASGSDVHILIVAEGATSRGDDREQAMLHDEVSALRDAAAASTQVIGALPPSFGGMPDNRLDGTDLLDIVKLIEAVSRRISPDLVYTHHAGDLNIDHRRVHEAVLTACRPLPGTSVRAIRAFETPSSTEWSSVTLPVFQPTLFVDITNTLDTKLAALRAYDSEMRAFPHPRSLDAVVALAKWRGASCGFEAAEAFMVIRELVGP